MRMLWTLFKVIVGLAVAIPLGILLFALAAGVVGTLVGLAFIALRLAIVGFVGYGLFRLARRLLAPRATPAPPAPPIVRELPSVDPYYEAALRELNAELGHHTRN